MFLCLLLKAYHVIPLIEIIVYYGDEILYQERNLSACLFVCSVLLLDKERAKKRTNSFLFSTEKVTKDPGK